MSKKDVSVYNLAQLIISADIILHKYSELNIKQKIELIKLIEKRKIKEGVSK